MQVHASGASGHISNRAFIEVNRQVRVPHEGLASVGGQRYGAGLGRAKVRRCRGRRRDGRKWLASSVIQAVYTKGAEIRSWDEAQRGRLYITWKVHRSWMLGEAERAYRNHQVDEFE
ncbi:hypothetical protein RW1_069_00320 [Rhodococcus wratislaviensis NBRC 100605]|uniref:Uncharacterized protein n=1 Tax=Rhodococcus wratislaviensis NBRC 100605 TaxID=1219028 RepID=X0PZW9_RHOWR|nr:hypothetical protein RW1_069_00320 [Rhodococcus wratislaviensis NBRC 100605]